MKILVCCLSSHKKIEVSKRYVLFTIIFGLVLSFTSYAGIPTFEYRNNKLLIHGLDKKQKVAFYSDKIILNNTNGVSSVLPFDKNKLCRDQFGNFEKWTYVENRDGSFSLISDNVVVTPGSIIDFPSSRLCRHMRISGNVKIQNSDFHGGDSINENLKIDGSLVIDGRPTHQLTLSNIVTPSSIRGRISGNVYMSNVELSGNITVDSCNVALKENTEHCLTVFPRSNETVININNLSKLSGNIQIFGPVTIYQSELIGTLMIQAEFLNSPVIVTNSFIEPSDSSLIKSNISLDDVNLNGKFILNSSDRSILRDVIFHGDNIFTGQHDILQTHFEGVNRFTCIFENNRCAIHNLISENQTYRKIIDSEFNGRYTISALGRDLVSAYANTFLGATSLAGATIDSGFNLFGEVSIWDATIGKDVTINGYFPNGVEVSNALVDDYILLQGKMIIRNSSILGNSELILDDWPPYSSNIFYSTLTNFRLNGGVTVSGTSVSNFSGSGHMYYCDGDGCHIIFK